MFIDLIDVLVCYLMDIGFDYIKPCNNINKSTGNITRNTEYQLMET